MRPKTTQDACSNESSPPMFIFRVLRAFLHTAFFRIWPTLLVVAIWSTLIVCINKFVKEVLMVSSTLLTVLGTILGLVLSYRTSSAYDRYWEGRRLWSQIITTSRTFARIAWIHCPDHTSIPVTATYPPPPGTVSDEERKRARKEKRVVIELGLAFAVAVKHYLRGEGGIYYEDLYPLVNFLPRSSLPSAIPPPSQAYEHETRGGHHISNASIRDDETDDDDPNVALRKEDENGSILPAGSTVSSRTGPHDASQLRSRISTAHPSLLAFKIPIKQPEQPLRPARCPPERNAFWRRRPRSVNTRLEDGTMRPLVDSAQDLAVHNIPLEVTLFMSSWIATLQRRKVVDVPTLNALLACVAAYADILSSLERILLTPIPWSYAAHIYEVIWIYCLILPFQIYATFGWCTIPACLITTYILVGLLDCANEIENPFGYDQNDLNLDYFCEHIIKVEMLAVVREPAYSIEDWMPYDSTHH